VYEVHAPVVLRVLRDDSREPVRLRASATAGCNGAPLRTLVVKNGMHRKVISVLPSFLLVSLRRAFSRLLIGARPP
jgi:hypothetical protein